MDFIIDICFKNNKNFKNNIEIDNEMALNIVKKNFQNIVNGFRDVPEYKNIDLQWNDIEAPLKKRLFDFRGICTKEVWLSEYEIWVSDKIYKWHPHSSNYNRDLSALEDEFDDFIYDIKSEGDYEIYSNIYWDKDFEKIAKKELKSYY